MRASATLFLALFVSTACTAQATARRPDVFLITIDTLRADHVHCYGDAQISTPALDALAKNGIRFSTAFTPSPITNTSHTSILTGLLPSSHGVTDFAVPLDPSHPTLAEMLKGQGYHSAAFIGAVILDSNGLAPGLNRGFDFYDNFTDHPTTQARWGRVERRGMDVVHRAEAWLAKHPAGPHFVWVHLYDPHDPYEPPSPYSQTYKGRLYDGEIAYADSALANFVAYIKARGVYDNAVVIAVADHGESLGEHGEDTHGIFLYDSTTHVPLIMKLPRNATAGTVVDAQVRTIDILPTVLDFVGAQLPEKLDGKSLLPYFTNSKAEDRVAFGETDYPLRFGWSPLRSVRTKEFKFIEAPRSELYDLGQDPAELKNKYASSDPTVLRLRAMLDNWQRPSHGVSAPSQQTDEQLKSSGYSTTSSSKKPTAPSSLPDPKDKIQEANLLHSAMLATDDRRPAEARKLLEKVLQSDPDSPTALLQLGEMELHDGDYAKAADHLRAACRVRPNDATAAFYEGQARTKIGDFAGARDALELSLKLKPGQLPARLLLGQAYLELKNPAAAEDQFEAASLLDSNNQEAQLGLARVQMAQGKPAAALDQLKPLASSNPKSPEAFDLEAQAYKQLGKEKEAQEAEARAKLLRNKSH
jgi:choline-sulfatase